MSRVTTIQWLPGPPPSVRLIDQSRLPFEEVYLDCHDHHSVADAIRTMKIRGAPAIGVAAAFGMALAAVNSPAERTDDLLAELRSAAAELGTTRPTAVNLAWALQRMLECAEQDQQLDPQALRARLIAEACTLREQDIEINHALGTHGATLLRQMLTVAPSAPLNLLTHCNAGALATAGYGTALGVVRSLVAAGVPVHVWVDETRPWLQGSRLTAWELVQEGIAATLIADNMAASFMRAGRVQAVIVGADRIARNGDVANKIGTYNLAVLARHHDLPFLVAAPVSTLDPTVATGAEIPIEERAASELTTLDGHPLAAEGIAVANPVFDITPHELVTAIITERGVLRSPFESAIAALVATPR